MNDLYECPFCGGTPMLRIVKKFSQGNEILMSEIVCTSCGATGPMFMSGPGSDRNADASSIDAWNTRLVSGKSDLCPFCGNSDVMSTTQHNILADNMDLTFIAVKCMRCGARGPMMIEEWREVGYKIDYAVEAWKERVKS